MKINRNFDFELFFDSYLEAALFTGWDEDVPMETAFCIGDFRKDALRAMRRDCRKFVSVNIADLMAYDEMTYPGQSAGHAGHDFWLTRNRHGAGFWDRNLGEVGDRLTEAAHQFGETYLWVTARGKVACD